MTKDLLTIAYSDDYLKWQLGAGDGTHPTNPIRAKNATEMLVKQLGDSVEIIEPTAMVKDVDALKEIHSPDYVENVIVAGKSNDWIGAKPEMGHTALQMFAGTARLVEKMIAGEITVGFNPQGAKHHAQYDHSEGFCVFNDFAWAALEFQKAGLKVAYVDWDVNAGDGVQNLLADTEIPTFSIHGHGIYPYHSDTWIPEMDGMGRYEYSNPEKHWYNYCLPQGAGDSDFAWAMHRIMDMMADYRPDVILLATGADGHEDDHWGLNYTYEGYEYASNVIANLANKYSKGRVLIGGAGGYQPHNATPKVWATVVKTIYTRTGSILA